MKRLVKASENFKKKLKIFWCYFKLPENSERFMKLSDG